MKYIGRFEKYIKDNYKTQNEFAKEIGSSNSAISKWINGKAFPTSQNIRTIWIVTKDEIGPMYWYTEWYTDVLLRNQSKDQE